MLNDSDCLDCHGDNALAETNANGRVISLFVDAARLAAYVHRTNSCISCHRVAGVILLLAGMWHLVYLISTPNGLLLLRDLFPVKKDLADVWCAARYLCGLNDRKPRIGRFGYTEKLEYWSVIWGTIIMGLTGLMVWFKISVTHWAPRWVVDVALTIHYYEAVLACLAIVVWHFDHVIFDPDFIPLILPAWTGALPKNGTRTSIHWPSSQWSRSR